MTTHMLAEIREIPTAAARLLDASNQALREAGRAVRARDPHVLVTVARGSSDHAASFLKYAVELTAGIPVASVGPSVASIYGAQLRLKGAACLAISQSGKSPDLLAATRNAKDSGALTVALCNTIDSPLMHLVDVAVPLHAGPERSVAATKSYITSLSCIAQLLANWVEDRRLLATLPQVPEMLARAWECDWTRAVETLRGAVNLFVVARGFGLGIAQEAALKLKETCGLHAEAFSSAEVKHGPMALVRAGFPVLMFTQRDETRVGIQELSAEFAARGARVLIAGAEAAGAISLPAIASHPVVEPLLTIQSFYRMANELALARGLDPDRPPHLNKVTETV